MTERFGLLYESTFTGSMVGTSPVVFAVWGYVVACGYGGQVTLNPRLLAPILGTTVADVEAAIRFHCQPDPDSRSSADEGRRLRHVAGFTYEIVNHDVYRNAKALEERRAYNRAKQRASRERSSSTTEVTIFDTSKKSLTESDALLSLSCSSDLDPEGVQGEGAPIRAPADFAPTEAQVDECRKLGLDAKTVLARFKRHEFSRDYGDWHGRFDTWIEDAHARKPRRGSAPPCGLEPTEAHRRFAAKHGLDPGVPDAIVADLVARDVPGTLGLGRARELIGSELSKAARARAQPTAA